MKKASIALLLLVSLTACGQSVEDVKKEAEFVKVCRDSGGRIDYDGWNQMFCNFYDRSGQ